VQQFPSQAHARHCVRALTLPFGSGCADVAAREAMKGPPEKTLNVSSTSTDWRGLALSNFGLSPFVLDGMLFASVEGFVQGIKFPEGDPRREAAFASSGWPAKHLGDTADRSGAYWGGVCLPYGSPDHHRLIEQAIRARIAQSKVCKKP